MPKYYVIAGGYFEFKDWKSRNYHEMLINGTIHGVEDIIYVSGANTMKGVTNPTGIFIGTWYKRIDIVPILQTLHTSVSGDKLDSIHKAWKIINPEGPMNI